MKTGIELIAIEREEQLEKHGRSFEYDVANNSNEELRLGAMQLLLGDRGPEFNLKPNSWSWSIFDKMITKPYKERLIIAGALIAAEIDRLQNQ